MVFTSSPPEAPVACFAIRALAEPGALPRVIEVFAKRGFVPSSVHSRLVGEGDAGVIEVDVQIGGLDEAQADIIAEHLRQIVVVDRVLTARKRVLRAA